MDIWRLVGAIILYAGVLVMLAATMVFIVWRWAGIINVVAVVAL